MSDNATTWDHAAETLAAMRGGNLTEAERQAVLVAIRACSAMGKAETHEMASAPQLPPRGDGAPVLPKLLEHIRDTYGWFATRTLTRTLCADLEARAKVGEAKYGTPLRAHNGRDAVVDAYQEALDLCMYLAQTCEEGKDCRGLLKAALHLALNMVEHRELNG